MKPNKQDLNNLKELFDEKGIDVLIGYGRATLPFRTVPCFIKCADDLNRLEIGPFMSANLVHYLNKTYGKKGILLKNCDIPSVVSLIQEERFTREDVVLVGLLCPGSIDLEKVAAISGLAVERIVSIDLGKEKAVLKADKNICEFDISDVIADKCLSCAQPVPDEKSVDLLIGELHTVKKIPIIPNPLAAKISDIDAMSSVERWDFWKNELRRCIRCYACKNACSVCYCNRCTVDVNNPQWVSPSNIWQDNMVYQVMRINHIAGRCTNCGECTRVCPVGIPLNLLTGKIFNVVVDNFKHVPGEDPNAKPPLTCFNQDDPEEFIY